MARIPSKEKIISIPNTSDVMGNIWYTKNIDLTEDGYIKLSSRSIQLYSQKDVPSLRVPTAFMRFKQFAGSVDFYYTQTGTKGYWLTLLDSGITNNVDQGTPAVTLTPDSHGVWFNNEVHVTDDTELYSKEDPTDVGNYTARSASLTSGKVHCLEVFDSRNTICIGNGNTVKQFTNGYVLSTTLTIPADLEVISLAYSNYQMGVLTMASDEVSNVNKEAFFFVWNGTTTSAQQGIPLGSDRGVALVAYKGSWVILTRTGELLFYTGGGFKRVGVLPFYYKDILWGEATTRDTFGTVMIVDGDNILFNFSGLLGNHGKNYEKILQNNPGGILCWNVNIGFYHRYSPSISPADILTVTSGNINTTTDILTKTTGTIPSTGSPIKYISDKTNQIGGLTAPTVYYSIKLSSTTFQLAETREKAEAGAYIDITSTGATNNYFLGLEVYDYGQSVATTTGAMGLLGKNSDMYDHIIFGAELNDFNSTSDYATVCITSPGFENRGYFLTPKIRSDNIEDNLQKIIARYRPFDVNDKMIIKYHERDILGLPVSTPQARISTSNQCTWTSLNSFYTSADLSAAKTALDNEIDLECEIIAGAGAGTLVQVSSIIYDSNTYVVTVAEAITGAGAERKCDIIIDNWTVIGEVTPDDTKSWKEIPVVKASSEPKLKFELRGVGTAIEEVRTIDKSQLPSV